MRPPGSMLIAVTSLAVPSGAARIGDALFRVAGIGGLLPRALGFISNHGFGRRDDGWTRGEQRNVRTPTRRERPARATSR